MKKIIFPILSALLVLSSCENTERLEQIKSALKGEDAQESAQEDAAVSISAPEQNIVTAPQPIETSSDISAGYDEPSYEEPSDFDRFSDESEY